MTWIVTLGVQFAVQIAGGVSWSPNRQLALQFAERETAEHVAAEWNGQKLGNTKAKVKAVR